MTSNLQRLHAKPQLSPVTQCWVAPAPRCPAPLHATLAPALPLQTPCSHYHSACSALPGRASQPLNLPTEQEQDGSSSSISRRSTLGPRPQLSAADQGVCAACAGLGRTACAPCNGTGWLARGGYNRKNPIPKAVINSKWTAMQETIGWRHFRCIQLRKGGTSTSSSPVVFLLMQASCDPTAQLWVNRETLRDRSRWAAGWLQRSEMLGPEAASETEPSITAEAPSADMQQGMGSAALNDTSPQPAEIIEGPSEEAAHEGSPGVMGAGSKSRATNGGGIGPSKGFGFRTSSGKARSGRTADAEPGPGAKPCRSCGGSGLALCRACDASGVALINL